MVRRVVYQGGGRLNSMPILYEASSGDDAEEDRVPQAFEEEQDDDEDVSCETSSDEEEQAPIVADEEEGKEEGSSDEDAETLDMIDNFVDHIAHQDEWSAGSFGDGNLLMEAVGAHHEPALQQGTKATKSTANMSTTVDNQRQESSSASEIVDSAVDEDSLYSYEEISYDEEEVVVAEEGDYYDGDDDDDDKDHDDNCDELEDVEDEQGETLLATFAASEVRKVRSHDQDMYANEQITSEDEDVPIYISGQGGQSHQFVVEECSIQRETGQDSAYLPQNDETAISREDLGLYEEYDHGMNLTSDDDSEAAVGGRCKENDEEMEEEDTRGLNGYLYDDGEVSNKVGSSQMPILLLDDDEDEHISDHEDKFDIVQEIRSNNFRNSLIAEEAHESSPVIGDQSVGLDPTSNLTSLESNIIEVMKQSQPGVGYGTVQDILSEENEIVFEEWHQNSKDDMISELFGKEVAENGEIVTFVTEEKETSIAKSVTDFRYECIADETNGGNVNNSFEHFEENEVEADNFVETHHGSANEYVHQIPNDDSEAEDNVLNQDQPKKKLDEGRNDEFDVDMAGSTSSCHNSKHSIEREVGLHRNSYPTYWTTEKCVHTSMDDQMPLNEVFVRGSLERGPLVDPINQSDFCSGSCEIETGESDEVLCVQKSEGEKDCETLACRQSQMQAFNSTTIVVGLASEIQEKKPTFYLSSDAAKAYAPSIIPEPIKKIVCGRNYCTDVVEYDVDKAPSDDDNTEAEGSVDHPIGVEDFTRPYIDPAVRQNQAVKKVKQSTDIEGHTPENVIIGSSGDHLRARIEAFGYYLDQKHNCNSFELDRSEVSFFQAGMEPTNGSGIYKLVPWTRDPEVDGGIIVCRDDISRVPSSLLGEFSRQDDKIRSVLLSQELSQGENSASKSVSVSVYTNPEDDVPTPLNQGANATDRLGTSLVVPSGMDDENEGSVVEYSIIAESLGMGGVEDACLENRSSKTEEKSRKSVTWNELAQVKSDDPFLSGPLKLNQNELRRNRRKKIKGGNCCAVFHDAPRWTKALVYVSISVLCISFGVIMTALVGNAKTNTEVQPRTRETSFPTFSPTLVPSIFFGLEPPKGVIEGSIPTTSPIANATTAPGPTNSTDIRSPTAAPNTATGNAAPTRSPSGEPATVPPTNRPPFLWGGK